MKAKDWWDNDLKTLFDQMKIAYQNYKQSFFSDAKRTEYEEAKKLEIERKRRNIKLKWNTKLKK